MNTIGVEKLTSSFVPGLDHVTDGGLPLGRATLVSGTAGICKTGLAAQFLAEGIRRAGQLKPIGQYPESASLAVGNKDYAIPCA